MKKILLILSLLLPLGFVNAANTLWEYYEGNLPTIEERALLYTGSDEYVGTAEQNMQLLSVLQGSESMVLGAALPQTPAVFQTTLAAPITSSATSMTLTSNSIRGGGSISGYTCFTIDEGSAQAENVCGTVSSTAVSSMTRGVSYVNGTSTDSDNQFAHRRGASVKVTDAPVLQILKAQNNGQDTFPNPLIYDTGFNIATTSQQIPYAAWIDRGYTNLFTNQTISGVKTFTGATTTFTGGAKTGYTCDAGSANETICDKAYIDSTANAGASDANYTTKGIAERATTAEIDAGTSLGGTSAALFINPLDFASSKWASTTMASSTSAVGFYSIPVKANDVLMIWAKSAGACQAADALYLTLKQSTMAATSTVDVTSCDAVDNDYFGLSTMYAFSATTTETINILVTGVIDERKIMFLKLPFNTAF